MVSFPAAAEHRRLLGWTARRVWDVLHGRPRSPALETEPEIGAWTGLGCFATWKTVDGGVLRGCVGEVAGRGEDPEGQSLADRAVRVALGAASGDPRFSPVTGEELLELTLGITLLGFEEAWHYPRDPAMLEIGDFGLHVIRGSARGILLPQVATEWGYDGEQFLKAACVKAGIDGEAWRERDTEVFRFPGRERVERVEALL